MADLRGMDDGYPVHRLPGGQQQDELAGHARLAAAEALAVAGVWRDYLPGADDSSGERADDAGCGGRGYVVLGAGAELKGRGAAGQPLFAGCIFKSRRNCRARGWQSEKAVLDAPLP